jgi:hypothetical protein
MDTTDAAQLKAICQETAAAVASIDAKLRDKLLKRARKQGITNEAEATELIEAWKRAARKTKRLHHS